MEGLRIAACFFSFVSLLLLIIALSSSYWRVDKYNSHVGLWQFCDGIRNICISAGIHMPEPYIHATRAFLFMGMIAGFVSFFGLCASFFRTHIGSISIKDLAVSASFLAGVFSMIAMSTFTGVYNRNFSSNETWYSWSFGIGWASFPLFLITGGLASRTVSISRWSWDGI